MICRCFGRTFDVSEAARSARAAVELVVGLPDYDRYVAHSRDAHPEAAVMSRDAFFRARQDARFGAGGGLRCC